jgi:hypothetical protein
MDIESILNSPIFLTIMKLLGAKYVDDQNAQNSITPIDAIKGSESKGLTGMQQYVNNRLGEYQAAQAGQTTNPMLAATRTNAQNVFNNANTPGQAAQIYGQPNQDLMTRLLALTQGGTANAPMVQNANNYMAQSLANRFTPRQRIGG